jgi:hypothetical protein
MLEGEGFVQSLGPLGRGWSACTSKVEKSALSSPLGNCLSIWTLLYANQTQTVGSEKKARPLADSNKADRRRLDGRFEAA